MKKRIFSLLSLLFCLNIIGLLSLYSSLHQDGVLINQSLFVKQVVWDIIGWILILVISFMNYRVFYDLSWWVYAVAALFLTAVIISGKMHMGAQRWIQILGITFQPSELAKLAVLLILSRKLSQQKYIPENSQVSFRQEIIVPFVPVSVIALLIFIQPDLGTALVTIFVYFLMLIGKGVRKRNLILFIVIICLTIPAGWFLLKDYQKARLLVFLNPNSDPLGTGYTIIQSKIAIGSGKIFGRGFLSGTQNQLNFLPARHTDFIFTVFAEEWGFLGCLILLSIYYSLLRIILRAAESSKDSYSYTLSLGIFSLFFTHVIINTAMVMGLIPVVGLPLPFLSYGGSFTLIGFMLIGIIVNILKHQE